jgi:hypothetical protein
MMVRIGVGLDIYRLVIRGERRTRMAELAHRRPCFPLFTSSPRLNTNLDRFQVFFHAI